MTPSEHLQAAKEAVAKKNRYKNWLNLAAKKEDRNQEVFLEFTIEAYELALTNQAEELRKEKEDLWGEACKAQRQICWSQLDIQANQNKVAKSPLAVYSAWHNEVNP